MDGALAALLEGPDPRALRRLLRARDRMDGQASADWTVARLAVLCAMSPAHFARAFHQAFGTPPHRYLLTRRIERAMALLRETDLAVTQIALQTGWNSQGTFGRVFREIAGCTPTQFRARAREGAAGLDAIPACHAMAAARPPRRTVGNAAVSEKRGAAHADTNGVRLRLEEPK